MYGALFWVGGSGWGWVGLSGGGCTVWKCALQTDIFWMRAVTVWMFPLTTTEEESKEQVNINREYFFKNYN